VRAVTFAPRERRILLWLTVAAVLWRFLLAVRMPVPAEDGVNYLWMAQRFAALDLHGALVEPFPPLWPLLLALPVACGAEPFAAGQVLGALLGGLSVWPIAAIAERLRAGAGIVAAALTATSSVYARTSGEVLSEPAFALIAGAALAAGLHTRWWLLGGLAGLASWVRPEGLALPFAFLLGTGLRAWPALPGLLLAVVGLAALRALAGHGFDPLPILAFHELRDDLPERGDLLANLIALPAAHAEAFLVPGALCLLALLPPRPRAARPLLAAYLLGLCGIATFVVRRRFFVSWAPCVLAFAAVGLAQLRPRLCELLLAVACGVDLLTAWHGVADQRDRLAERRVGEHLAAVLPPGASVAGDLTRVRWFAGSRPLPPRHFAPDALIAEARQAGVQFVVLSERSTRGAAAPVRAGLAGEFARYELPPGLADAAAARGILVLVRR
jgi:hypothetical protein